MKIQTPKHVWQLRFEGDWPTSVAFVGNGQRLAAGNRGGQIFLWDLPDDPPAPEAESKQDKNKEATPPDHAPTRQFAGHSNGVSHLLATRDGKTLISSSLDHTIRFWDVDAVPSGTANVVLDATDRERRARYKPAKEKPGILEAPGIDVEIVEADLVLEAHQEWINSLAISEDESRLVSGDAASQVVCWDLAARKEIARWTGHAWNGIIAGAVSPDGQTACLSEFGYKRDDFDIPAAGLRLWNASDGAEKLDLLKLQFPKMDPQATSYGSAQVWRKFVANGLIAVAFSPDGKWIATGQGGETGTGKVHLFDAETGKFARSVSGHRYGICDVQFSADSKLLVSSGRDTTVRICQVDDGKEVAVLGKSRGGQFKDWIHAIAISADQKSIAGADIAGFVHVWQL